MNEVVENIRGVLIPVSGGKVLLPNATVSEVITYSEPDAIEGAPAWLLGRLSWRGWRLPLFSFGILAGLADHEGSSNAKVTVLKALGGHPRLPFMAMLAQGFPRLTTLNPGIIVSASDDEDLPVGVHHRVQVGDDEAMIPDLGIIESMIADALDLAHQPATA